MPQGGYPCPIIMQAFFGAQYRACTLAPSSSRLPLPGLPVDFATGAVANLSPGRAFVCNDHLLGNNIKFHLLMESPDDSGFNGREN